MSDAKTEAYRAQQEAEKEIETIELTVKIPKTVWVLYSMNGGAQQVSNVERDAPGWVKYEISQSTD